MNEYYEAERKLSETHEWRKWCSEIPFLNLPSSLEFKPLPPFAGAVARFMVRKKGGSETISVYFDPYENLGFFGSPYWEMYPDVDGDVFRCAINETDILVKQIVKAINKLERRKKANPPQSSESKKE